jgi:dipeptidase E
MLLYTVHQSSYISLAFHFVFRISYFVFAFDLCLMKILALSSSRAGNGGYLEAAAPMIREFIGEGNKRAAFIPFASVDRDYVQYLTKVQEALNFISNIQLVDEPHGLEVIRNAEVILVGGGNTFKLLHDLYHFELVELLREKVGKGALYIGWSAGANITGKTIGTTNDMPIVQPRSFDALQFLPFQINPHYLNQKPEGFHGETRDQRLEEFVKMNPGLPVVGIPEGTALRRDGNQLSYMANVPALLLENKGGIERRIINPGEDLSFLL